jgi:hypothetical protein
MRTATAILAAAALAAAATAASAPASVQSYTTFKTPTGNIECGVFITKKKNQTLLRCDIRTGLRPKVKRPRGCHFDFGSTLELKTKGKAIIGCVSDAVGPVKKVLRYGKTYRKGPFICTSARAGLTCKNRSRHGFFLSKRGWHRI